MILTIHSFGADNELFKLAMKVRFEVFTKEQGIDKNIEFDGLDFEAVHYLIMADNKPIAAARWRETADGLKIERLAVIKEYRSLGIGTMLLKMIISELKKAKKQIYLHAQTYLQKYYECHGFKPVGEKFMEANIEHIKMIYSQN